MSRIARFAVLMTTLASLFAALSSTANAVTWHNTGSTAFTATGGSSTLSVGANNLACTASSTTGTAPGGSTVGVDITIAATRKWDPCTLAGQSVKRHCTVENTGVSIAGGIISFVAKLLGCKVTLSTSGTVLCEFHGTVPGSYANPSGATPGRFTYSTASTVTVTNGPSGSCPLGTGSATVSEETSTITSVASSPIITRTP